MFSPKKILVTTDFSGDSDNAVNAASEIAEKYSSELYLMHVLSEIDSCLGEYCMVKLTKDDAEKVKKNMMDAASKKLKEEIAKAIPKKGVKIQQVIRFGVAIDEIIKEVDEKKIDLLVIAPHKHKSWAVFFSHLSDELVKKSGCKTLLVKN